MFVFYIIFVLYIHSLKINVHWDYCSQLSSTAKPTDINSVEAPYQDYFKKVFRVDGLTYWWYLTHLKLQSEQKRHNRYKVIYCYMIVNALVPNPGLTLTQDSRRGPLISGMRAKKGCCGWFIYLRESSSHSSGPKLFNCLPRNVHFYASARYGLDVFTFFLDHYQHFLTLIIPWVWDPHTQHLTLFWPMFISDHWTTWAGVPRHISSG